MLVFVARARAPVTSPNHVIRTEPSWAPLLAERKKKSRKASILVGSTAAVELHNTKRLTTVIRDVFASWRRKKSKKGKRKKKKEKGEELFVSVRVNKDVVHLAGGILFWVWYTFQQLENKKIGLSGPGSKPGPRQLCQLRPGGGLSHQSISSGLP